MLKLTYTTKDGRQFTKLINEQLIAQIEEDPRHDKSHSIVHTTNGEKLFCVQTIDELYQQLNLGSK